MPDYADNYTARYVMTYLAGQMTHRFAVRYGTAASFGDIAGAVDALTEMFDPVKDLFSGDLSFQSAVFYPRGSDIAQPADLPAGIAALVSTQATAKAFGPQYLSLPWKTQAGAKQTIFFYGIVNTPSSIPGGDFRYEVSALSALATARNRWVGMPQVTGNDSTPIRSAATYFNYGVNPKLVRKARRG